MRGTCTISSTKTNLPAQCLLFDISELKRDHLLRSTVPRHNLLAANMSRDEDLPKWEQVTASKGSATTIAASGSPNY